VSAGTCAKCGKAIQSTWDVIEVRKEYRRVAGLARERTWLVRILCRECAQAEWDAHDNPSGAQQGSLL
jgi:hypothetical protein